MTGPRRRPAVILHYPRTTTAAELDARRDALAVLAGDDVDVCVDPATVARARRLEALGYTEACGDCAARLADPEAKP